MTKVSANPPEPTKQTPAAPQPWVAPQAPVGMPVQWFPTADPNEQPHAATVIQVQPAGSLSLSVLLGSGRILRRTGVKHIEDPSLQRMSVEMRANRGAWGFIPLIARTPVPQNVAEQEQLILTLHAEGKPMAHIVRELGNPWTPPKINAVLHRHGIKPR